MTEKMTFLLKVRDGYKKAHWDLEELVRDKLVDIKHLPTVRVMIRKFKSKLEKTDKEIEAIRKTCSHNFEFACTGHNSNFYDCTECGESKER
jgi:sulfur relay (sulfurtransferase) DsrC/TusE family protein